uniref:Tyrosine-protein kinase receptor n=1 Tax=Eptatretus burgeri TaxID=7764 RepID=A0A8C4WT67_EPTBU
MALLTFSLLSWLVAAALSQVDTDLCRYPLGMEDGSIADEDITASSEWNDSTGAKYARLRTEAGDGAWCATWPVAPGDGEFLQVDLGRLHLVTLVATQGRHAGGLGNEFARTYRLEYSRDSTRWLPWRNRRGEQVLRGNDNTQNVEIRELNPPMVARYVRMVPVTDRAMSVCLRLELYGCAWADGVVSYSAPEGHVMQWDGSPIHLNDSTYDGFISAGQMYGGLGQLTDGVWGRPDFPYTREANAPPGYDYVGWRNGSLEAGVLRMEFEFDSIRNFSAIKLHCATIPSIGAHPVHSAICDVRPTPGAPWEGRPLLAEKVEGETQWKGEEQGHVKGQGEQKGPLKGGELRGNMGGSKEKATDSSKKLNWKEMQETNDAHFTSLFLGYRSGIAVRCLFQLTGTWLLLSEISFISDFTQEYETDRLQPSFMAEATVTGPTLLSGSFPGSGVTQLPIGTSITESGLSPERPGNTALLIGCLLVIILLLVVIIILILWRQNWKKLLEKAPHRILEENMAVRLSLPSEAITLPRHRSLYKRVPPAPPLPPGYQQPLNLPHRRTDGSASDGGEYAELEMGVDGARHYAVADILDLQGVTGGNTYAVPAASSDGPFWDPQSLEVPREQLQLKEKLGEGQFGEVLLCAAKGLPGFTGDESVEDVLVAVKILREDASVSARSDFVKEIKTISRLCDPNIVRLLAVCLRDDPLVMVTEYMPHGDLHQFLERHKFQQDSTSHDAQNISLLPLMRIIIQIASGMKYLASLNYVHRDLATRNCLVGHDLTIKIADFGMSRNLYSSDYYRIQGRAVLPIRWMAWESILLGKFSTASDVWAFGVTLWEVMTVCREQPYAKLSDEQVIENTAEFFRNNNQQQYLSYPEACPQPVYQLMLQCWKKESQERPVFQAIHKFLIEATNNIEAEESP